MKTILKITLAASLLALVGGCNNSGKATDTASAQGAAVVDHDEAKCGEIKPGVVTSVNKYCAVVQQDPVDPKLVAEYKGQKVGFCCPHCVGTWNKMTDAQKTASLASAMKKN